MCEKKIKGDLDAEIKHFHSVDDQKTEYLFSKYFSKDKIPTVEYPKEDPSTLFSQGVEKWGRIWSTREYELREIKRNSKKIKQLSSK